MFNICSLVQDNNGPGLQGNVVDSEGFPRADIDVVRVRQQRNRFAVLKTEHKALSAEIEKLVHIALAPQQGNNSSSAIADEGASQMSEQRYKEASSHEATKTQTSSGIVNSETGRLEGSIQESISNPNQVTDLGYRQPFATVDIVSPSSPSANAGLFVNDHIVSFGAVSLRTSPTPSEAISLLPGVLREHENRTLDVIVHRGQGPDTKVVTLALTPRRWSGQGLLGCHIKPIEVNQTDPRYAPEVATAAAIRSNSIN